ncbi:hypothetical protein CCL08_02695 [Pseudomonas congelans]|uniref:T6SS immunity protein Tli4 family protein n=1 Tax=Pseudomonas congelans TaxID=200452 RepID=UPI000BB9476A|nr:T6SS immunity protein Tli4 family protein [Pseudomonas congelans]PBQ21816.1 hypothetical protein CCL08_02695 [Pseudomonas congelans]
MKKIRLLQATHILILALLTGSADATSDMPTEKSSFYFGRYTLQVPTDGADIWSAYKVVGQNIEHISHDGKRDLETRLPNVISKINKLHKVGYAAYEQTVSLEGGGAVVVSRSTSYDFDIYYMTASNTLYRQVVEGIPLNALNQVITLAKELNTLIHDRNPTESPPSNTFALEAGYMNLPVDTFEEQVSIGLPVSSVPGIHLTFDTQRIGQPEPGLIARYEQRTSGVITSVLSNVLSSTSVLRKSKRTVAGLPFEELLLKTRADGRTLYAFRLEYPGTPESSMEPYTVLELSTLDKGVGFKSDQEALRFWDEMVRSMKRI